MSPSAVASATPAVTTGSSQSTGLRYVTSSRTMTTARVAYRSVPSIPLNALAESAAPPSGPATCTTIPLAPVSAILRSLSTVVGALFQPLAPRFTGTTVSIALPSLDGNGPAT